MNCGSATVVDVEASQVGIYVLLFVFVGMVGSTTIKNWRARKDPTKWERWMAPGTPTSDSQIRRAATWNVFWGGLMTIGFFVFLVAALIGELT